MADTEKWGINESLLQSYRSLFISSQSFLLAVGAIVAGKSTAIVLVVAALSFLMIWAIWFPVVKARHRIVDYYKFRSSLSEQARRDICSEGEYVHRADLRARANEIFGIATNWRATRVKLDLLTPLMFTAIWFSLVVYDATYA